jgi:hypothetical protein
LPSPAGVLTFCSVRNTLLACEKIAIIRNPNHELRLHNILHTFSVSIRLNRSQTLTFWQYRFEGCLKSCLSTDPPRSWQPWSRDVSVKCWTKHDRHDSTGFNRSSWTPQHTSIFQYVLHCCTKYVVLERYLHDLVTFRIFLWLLVDDSCLLHRFELSNAIHSKCWWASKPRLTETKNYTKAKMCHVPSKWKLCSIGYSWIKGNGEGWRPICTTGALPHHNHCVQ